MDIVIKVYFPNKLGRRDFPLLHSGKLPVSQPFFLHPAREERLPSTPLGINFSSHSPFFFTLHGRRDSNSRHLVLETSALPTELHPFIFTLKGIPPWRDTSNAKYYTMIFNPKSWLPDLHQQFYHLHG